MNKLLLALAAVLAVAVVSASAQADADVREMFTNFMHEHKITYGVHEFQYRYGVFKSNVELIRSHNAAADKTYTLGVNRFADFTNEEYRYRMLGYRHDSRRIRKNVKPALVGTEGLPDSVDWRDKNAVTPIKDQGQCGSCWAFSATGGIEGAHSVGKGQLVSVSEQQLVDCSRSYGNMGCNGGLMDYSFEYVVDNKGIDSEDSYPYQSGTGNDRYNCRFQSSNVASTITGYVNIAAGSESSLQAAVATHGPVSVAIDAGHSSFQFYKSGIYNEPHCSPSMLDHGVLAIGYGTNGTTDFWLVKNSWGTVWGDQGLIKMMRNANNQCGIATAASYPTV